MVSATEVEQQLKRIGANLRFWGHAESLELQHILIPGEQIQHCVNIQYEGGFATVCATNHRLLLIDKRLFHLFVEDIRYDMVSEVDYSTQILTASVRVGTPSKKLIFTGFRPKVLRALASYVQQRVLEIRQQYAYHSGEIIPQIGQPQPSLMEAQLIEPPEPLPELQTEAQTATGLNPVQIVKEVVANNLGHVATGVEYVTKSTAAINKPQFRNPYTQGPVMMRRRVGRFGATFTR
jgi:hypothetical protein